MSSEKEKEKRKQYKLRRKEKEKKEKEIKEKEKEELSTKLKNKLNNYKSKRDKDSFEHKSFRLNLRKNNGNVMKTLDNMNISEENIGNIINKINLRNQ